MTGYEVATALLEALEASFEAAAAPCARSYVSDGSVTYDFDEHLAVEWALTEPNPGTEGAPGTPADMSSGTIALQYIFEIHVVRHSPWTMDDAGTPATPAALTAHAEVVAADAHRVLDTILARLRDGSLFGVCGSVMFLGQSAIGPDGAAVGSVTRISVAA